MVKYMYGFLITFFEVIGLLISSLSYSCLALRVTWVRRSLAVTSSKYTYALHAMISNRCRTLLVHVGHD